MQDGGDWDYVRGGRHSAVVDAGIGAVRLALLFGSAAIALALIATPMLDRTMRPQVAMGSFAEGLDMTSTGSVRHAAGARYTIRRSVLQATPGSVCLIRDNGTRSGDC